MRHKKEKSKRNKKYNKELNPNTLTIVLHRIVINQMNNQT